MNINPLQFGKLVLREKSIRTIGGEEILHDFRSAKKHFKDTIEKLDRAGMDIEIRMTENKEMGEESKTVWASLANKQREYITGSAHSPKTHPWTTLSSVIAHAFSAVEIQQANVIAPLKTSGKFTQSGQDEVILVKTKGRGTTHPELRKDIKPGTIIEHVR